MTTFSQSRSGAMKLAIAVTVALGVVGCGGGHPTPSGPSATGETSSSAAAQALVDVSAVWATHPLPECPKPPIERNGGVVPPGIELPTEKTVSDIIGDAKSPASKTWVKAKLGWVTKWLLKVRGDIVDTPGDNSMLDGFHDYVQHVRAELEAGHDIPDSALDGDYPEGCA